MINFQSKEVLPRERQGARRIRQDYSVALTQLTTPSLMLEQAENFETVGTPSTCAFWTWTAEHFGMSEGSREMKASHVLIASSLGWRLGRGQKVGHHRKYLHVKTSAPIQNSLLQSSPWKTYSKESLELEKRRALGNKRKIRLLLSTAPRFLPS